MDERISLKEHFKNALNRMKMNRQHIKNLWYTFKAVLSWKCTAQNACIRKKEKSQINHLTSLLNKLDKEQNKTKSNRGQEIIKVREIN